MAGSFLMLILLLAGAAFLSVRFNKPLEQTLPVWVFAIILILYIFGICGALIAGVYIIAVLGLAAVIYSAYSFVCGKFMFFAPKNLQAFQRPHFKALISAPGVIIFLCFFLLMLWANNGRMFSAWDEFSHWGLSVKNMFILDALTNHPDSTCIFTGYPPASALFEYLWAKMSGAFSEGGVYHALDMMYFCAMLPLFSGLKWKNAGRIMIRAALILLLPAVFYSDFYTSAYIDAMLGVLFAYILINHFTGSMDSFRLISSGLAAFVLTLLKDSGFGLSLIALSIIAADVLFFKRKDIKAYPADENKLPIKAIAALSSPVLFLLAAKYSWTAFLALSDTPSSGSAGITFAGIASVLNHNAPGYMYGVIKEFLSSLVRMPFSGGLIPVSWAGWIMVFLITGTAAVVKCAKGERKRLGVAVIFVFAGLCAYALFLLLLYLFKFSEYEALRLQSFQRYLSTYLLGAGLFLSALLAAKEQSRKWRLFSTGFIVFVLLAMNLTPMLDITVNAPLSAAKTRAIRSAYSDEEYIASKLDARADKVYFVSVADKGYDYWVSRYILTPVKTNGNFSWSPGGPYFEGDIWSKNISPAEWAAELKDGYTYVYVFRTNDTFSAAFGALFEGGRAAVADKTLYSVDKSRSGITLRKADIGQAAAIPLL